MGSKYFDIVIGLFMAYFAYSRFMNDQIGFAILFTVLFLLNIVTFTVKAANDKKNKEHDNI